MKNLILPTGELVQTDFKAAVIRFETPRKVMSTSVLNGGIQKGLTAVFNYDELQDSKKRCEMRAKTYKEHLEIVAKEELGLLPEKTTGLTTAAQIKNMADCTMDYDDFKLMTIVTAGVSVNGLRAGDPATLHQKEGEPFEVGGTINIILSIDADLTDGAMLQALMTCTEAKTAALQELLCPSQKSREIATGTGTDGVIIIANPDASVHLTDSGKHFKL
ncbi:MAG: adenosylcobinamide amidohydrolase, partial [Eubacterium sp.]